MHINTKRLALTLLTLLSCASLHADCMLKPGDRMVFLGDSITEQRIYTRYVMDYFALRYPGERIEFRNAGWVNDTAPGGLKRLERDVLALKPTVVSICYGMNDAGVTSYKQSIYDRYIGAVKELVDMLRAKGIRVVLLTPGCVDESKASRLAGYNETLGRFASQLMDFAAKENIPAFNIHAPMLDVLNKAKAADPSFVMMNDGIHPNSTGHAIMAYGLIKALGCAGAVSSATIDAAASRATCDRCKVSDLKVADDAITFTRTDDALPAYFDDSAWAVFKYFPIVRDLDSYRLKVTGLKPGKWLVLAEKADLGTFTSEELASGVELADAPGPWKPVAQEVDKVTAQQEDFYYTRWRQLQLGRIPEACNMEKQALLEKMDAVVAAAESDRIAKAVGQHAWRWRLESVQ